MEEEDLRRVLNVIYRLWHGGKIGQDTIEAARRIRAHQGYHEAEVSCRGEADLLKHYSRCQKNPGHSQFIPVQDFKKEHLPPGYRDDDILDYIRAEADLTCRLSVDYTSENRPKYDPSRPSQLYPFSQDRGGDWMRVGTGNIQTVLQYTKEENRNCECAECMRPGAPTPHKAWGLVVVNTAKHVVFDDDEARRTTCHFGYDTTVLTRDCLKLTGFKVLKSHISGDWCKMIHITHDINTLNELHKMYLHHMQVSQKYTLNKKYRLGAPGVSCVTDPKPRPVVIISHPHGQSKHITVGVWTHRKACGEMQKYTENGWQADRVGTIYTYNTHTCPGSSGAPVIRLLEKGEGWWRLILHTHSEGGKENNDNNRSAIMVEYLSRPRDTGCVSNLRLF